MSEPVEEDPWVLAADLRDWLDPSLRYAVEDDPEAARLIARATVLVLGACTVDPDRTKYRQREAVQEAVKLTVEQRIVAGVAGSVSGGRISIGQVTYGGGASGSSQAADAPLPPVPAAALYALRKAGLISTAVVAY